MSWWRCFRRCRNRASVPWFWPERASISAPGWIWWSITGKTAARLNSCTSACAGTRLSTKWNMAACRSSPRCKAQWSAAGLELASAAHIRVQTEHLFRLAGRFTRPVHGGGATIRVADLVGKARMIDMMLTGRIYKGQEAVDVGLAQYLVEGSSF